MQLIEVTTQQDKLDFIKLAIKIYKNHPNWIRPLDKDIEAFFDKKLNKTFRNGECTRWIIKNDKGEALGRIAAFVNKKTAKKNKQPTGGLGMFECIDDQKVAFELFDQAKVWLQERGMEAMDGPINFGDRDKWWGLLIEGYDKEPNYNCNYNPPYYKDLFEAYGFQVYFNQLTYARKMRDPFDPKIMAKAEKVKEDPDYHFEHLKKNNIAKYTEDFRNIYNEAWARHAGVAKMTSLQAKAAMKKMKPIMDEKIIWYGYYKNEPVAFYIMLPEVNQIFKYVNGKLDWIGKLKFVYHKWRKSCNKALGLVFGVVPKHQGKGVEGALIMAAAQMVQVDYARYDNLEMNWIGDFNPKMIRVVEQVGGYVGKKHATYRKLFDENQPFERAPMQ